jgi:hypothetical protein
MKNLFRTALAAVATTFLVSCIADASIDSGKKPVDEGKPAILSFQPQMGGHSATRAETYDQTYADFIEFFDGVGADVLEGTGSSDPDRGTGRAADRKISTFRVLVYYGAGNTMGTQGDLVIHNGQPANHLFDWIEGDDKNEPPFEFELLTGTYDFVFVANDQGLFGADRSDTNCATLDGLKTQKFTCGGGTDGEICSEDPIPMVSYFSGVDVALGYISFTDAAGRYGTKTPGAQATVTGTWSVWMERAAIRLSFGFHMGRGQFEAWSNHHGGTPLLYIDGLRSAGFVLPQPALGGYSAASNGAAGYDLDTRQHAAYNLASSATVKPGKIMQNADGTYEVFFDRLVYPEHLPTDKADATRALRAYMFFSYDGQAARKEMLVQTEAGDCSLPRNTWVWARANIFTDIDYRVKIVPWGDAALDVVDISQHELKTGRSEFLFRASAASERMDVFTDRAEGWTIDPIAAADGWISVSPMKGDADKTTLTSVAVAHNTSGEIRSGTFTIRAGNLHRRVMVTQLPASGAIVDTPVPNDVLTYVGAFWKASQYGERLIRIKRPTSGNAIDGAWAAYVIEGEDWIILDTGEPASEVTWSSDPATSGNDTGFDAAHRVSGYATSVSGELPAVAGGAIYFRIGLNGQYTPTAEKPARYGVVLLVYGGASQKYRRIWIRQGEGADYLMRAGDVAADVEDVVARFSPYNLTAKEYMGAGSTELSINVRPTSGTDPSVAVFTDYPSQAGAHFQWASPGEPWAFHPVANVLPVWDNTAVTGVTWDTVKSKYETCPQGYRRPADGPTDVVTGYPMTTAQRELSEMEHSLNYNTPNSVFGAYADGFFDRRAIADDNAVDAAKSTAGYVGRVIYNPANNASLFFPAAGSRTASDGSLNTAATNESTAGKSVNYWSASLNTQGSALSGWNMRFTGDTQYTRISSGVANGFSIRCVEDESASVAKSKQALKTN